MKIRECVHVGVGGDGGVGGGGLLGVGMGVGGVYNE